MIELVVPGTCTGLRSGRSQAVMCKNKVELTPYRSGWSMSRNFEGSYRMWISKYQET